MHTDSPTDTRSHIHTLTSTQTHTLTDTDTLTHIYTANRDIRPGNIYTHPYEMYAGQTKGSA